MGFKRRRKPSKWQFGSKILLRNVIASRNLHKKDLMMLTGHTRPRTVQLPWPDPSKVGLG
jgi:hypothetical protein